MTRATSIAAFHDGIERQTLSAARREALAALREHSPCTAAELERATGLRHVNKRLSELRRDGLAVELPPRVCRVSGHRAIEWRAGTEDSNANLAPGRAPRVQRVAPSAAEKSGRYCMHVDDHGRPYCAQLGDKCPDCGAECIDVRDEGPPYGVVRTMARTSGR